MISILHSGSFDRFADCQPQRIVSAGFTAVHFCNRPCGSTGIEAVRQVQKKGGDSRSKKSPASTEEAGTCLHEKLVLVTRKQNLTSLAEVRED